MTAVVGVGLGYPLTGVIAEHLSFHAGFWLAAILGLLAMVLVALVVPTSMHRPSQPFDALGAALLALGLATLLIAISEGEEWGWTSTKLIVLAVVSVAVLAAWVRHEVAAEHPLVDLRQMRNRTVLTADVTGILAGVGMYMMMSMIIRYVQTPTTTSYGLGASVVVAGLVLLPMSAMSFASSKIVTYVSRWVRPARILPVGALLFALALVTFAVRRDHLWEIFVVMGVGGLAIGCSFAVMPRMIVGSVSADETSSALALNQVLRTVGYSIGSALSATILTAHTVAPSTLPSNEGYTVGALIAVGLCLVAGVLSAVLPTHGHAAVQAEADADVAVEIEESVDAALAGTVAYEPDEPEVGEAVGRHALGRTTSAGHR